MPVENRVNKVLYNGDGTTKNFQFSFKIFKEENIVVSIVNADGTETTKTLGSDYYVSSDDFNLGGTVTMKVAPLATEKLFIIRSIPLVQDANFRPVSGFPEEVITDGFDAGIMIDQDLQEQIDRCLRAPSFVNTDYTLPEAEAGKALVWDKDGKIIVNSDETINNVVAESTAQAQIATEKAVEATKKAVEASASANAAATSEASAKASESLAKDWAIEMDGTVDGTDYSAKYWAKVAEQGAYRDVGMPIGTTFSHTCSASFVPENSLPCDGSEYSKTQFATLYNNWLVGGRLNTCTYSQYQSDIDTYGRCGKWGLDTENGKFKTPYIPDGTYIQQAMTNDELGKSYNAGLPNITGQTRHAVSGNGAAIVSDNGALETALVDTLATGLQENTMYGRKLLGSIGIDASRSNPIYGGSDTVQTEAISLHYFVVVATGSIKQSEVDWSQWASSLQSKANVDMNNLSTAGKAEVAGLGFMANVKEDISGQVSMAGSPVLYTAERTGYVQVTGNNAQNGLFLNVFKPEATMVDGKIDASYLLISKQFYLSSGSGNTTLSVGVRKGQKYIIARASTNTEIAGCWFVPAGGVKE